MEFSSYPTRVSFKTALRRMNTSSGFTKKFAGDTAFDNGAEWLMVVCIFDVCVNFNSSLRCPY